MRWRLTLLDNQKFPTCAVCDVTDPCTCTVNGVAVGPTLQILATVSFSLPSAVISYFIIGRHVQ